VSSAAVLEHPCLADCKESPCGVCRQVKRARQRALACGYRGPHFTGPEWRALLFSCGWRCLSCGTGEDLSVDHVVPLSLGGANTIENVQVLCQECNGEKGLAATDYRPSSIRGGENGIAP